MKKIDLGQTLGLLANVGVIAGIVFLAIELHQNNELLEAEANLELARNRISANETLLANGELATAFLRGLEGQELSALDQFRLQRFYISVFTRWEWEYSRFLDGLIDEAALPVRSWREAMRTWPGVMDVWESTSVYDRTQVFVEFMEQNVLSEASQR